MYKTFLIRGKDMKILKTIRYMEKEAGQFGIYKYKCDTCGEFTNLSRRERSSSSIPRCSSCGSTYLDPVTDFANTELLNNQTRYNKSVDQMREKMNF
jgi:ribosomal protein L37AE/L43A